MFTASNKGFVSRGSLRESSDTGSRNGSRNSSRKPKSPYMLFAGIVLACLISFAFTGCGGQKPEQKTAPKKETAGITAVGSTALQPLVEAASEQYMKENPKVQITVQGGGSGQGLSQIAQGAVQIGNSDVFAESKIKDKALLAKIKDNKVAVIGMGPVVNKEVGVDNISMDNLKKVFMGKITNWKDLGGKDQKIIVINRASGSGTRATFESNVFGSEKAPESFKPQEQDSSGAVAKMVSTTPGAISYLAFSYLGNNNVKALKVDGVAPTSENVETNAWKIWSYEHMYVSVNADPATLAFVKYMQGDEVQGSLVSKHGYISIKNMKVVRDASGQVTKN